MNSATLQPLTYWLLLLTGVAAPMLFPDYTNQIAVLWLMIVFALTWDILGGQMGYNSLGNIFFFGAGMYVSAVTQIGLFYDVGVYTSAARTTHIAFSPSQYFTGFALGTAAGGLVSAVLAIGVGFIVFGLRGPYFAIGTLGVAVAAAELVSSWEWVGAASGISLPVFPGGPEVQKLFFYFLLFALSFILFCSCAGSIPRISDSPSTPSATTRRRRRRWGCTRAATSAPRWSSRPSSSDCPARSSET
jgi:branched-chain amino acid transport system permease protein